MALNSTSSSVWDLRLKSSRTSPVDRLLEKHLPNVIDLFRNKARDYDAGDIFTADHLGAAGQYAEIWRKIPKLKKALWDGNKLEGEQTVEVLQDIIGHCLLAIDFIERSKDGEIVTHRANSTTAIFPDAMSGYGPDSGHPL